MIARIVQESRPEERFVELFQDVFGPAAAAMLEPQVYFRDIAGRDRYIDFALESLVDRFALEIDGETYHHPSVLTSEEYEDQLLRQNSLNHLGWRVLRWTDRQLRDRPEDVKEQISVFLDQVVRLTVPQRHLPCKRASLVELHEHQSEALEELKRIRAKGDQIALLSQAVGSGKTTVAIEDARAVGLRTLFLAHTYELVEQAQARFSQLWREAPVARLGTAAERDATIVVGTI
ncbi:MAG: DEAD/DEAH box helicase family protein, partial [Chloroflexi bacterium]|nr:DEAD/DEAH box helicase family protein [Chloroflexota bacterium]